MLRVLGQIFSTYIIAEGPDGIFLIDQHSAHERVLYEQLMAERVSAKIATQDLLDPLTLQLTPAQHAALATNRDALTSVGFRIEEFGAQTSFVARGPRRDRFANERSARRARANHRRDGARGRAAGKIGGGAIDFERVQKHRGQGRTGFIVGGDARTRAPAGANCRAAHVSAWTTDGDSIEPGAVGTRVWTQIIFDL